MNNHKFYGLLLPVFLTFGGIVATAKVKKVPAGTWISTAVIIDGNDSDWSSPYPYYDAKARISYAAGNDGRRLYITFKTGDELIKRKIITGGVKVWIDPAGKKEEFLSVNYPVAGPPPSGEDRKRPETGFDGRPQVRDGNMRNRPPLVINPEVILTGFPADNGSFKAGKPNPANIEISAGYNDFSELVWEAAIPLDRIYTGAAISALAGQPLSICFEIGAMPVPARAVSHQKDEEDGETGNGMRQGGGMGGSMGGRMGGGGRHGNAGGNHGGGAAPADEEWELLSKTTKTWFKTSIAAP